MGDPADVGLVDPHAESHRRHDDQPVLLLETKFGVAALFRVHAGVVVNRRMARLAQREREDLALVAAAAIDDARLPLAGSGKAQDLVARAVLDGEAQADVRPVEAAQEGGGRLAVEEPRDHLGPGLDIGRGGEGGERHGQITAQLTDAQVIGAEVMAPLADAMRLVHGDQPDAHALEHGDGARQGQPFRREVEELEPPGIQRAEDLFGLGLRVARGQRPGLDPGFAQAAHLVAHQRDQRRYHHGDPRAAKRRQLEAQGLAAARGHDGQRRLAFDHRLDDLFLTGTKTRKAPDLVEQLFRWGHGRDLEHMGLLPRSWLRPG